MPKIAISVMSRAGSCIRLVAFGDVNSPQIPAVASGALMPNTHCTAPLEVRDPH